MYLFHKYFFILFLFFTSTVYAANVHGAPINPMRLVFPSVSLRRHDKISDKKGTSALTSDRIRTFSMSALVLIGLIIFGANIRKKEHNGNALLLLMTKMEILNVI